MNIGVLSDLPFKKDMRKTCEKRRKAGRRTQKMQKEKSGRVLQKTSDPWQSLITLVVSLFLRLASPAAAITAPCRPAESRKRGGYNSPRAFVVPWLLERWSFQQIACPSSKSLAPVNH
jgi:hypothetical protein